MCLAQGHNAVAPVRLEPTETRSRVKHATTTVNLNFSILKKLLYEMKKSSCYHGYSFAITLLSSILANCVRCREEFPPTSPKGLVFVARTDFVYSKTSKI